ncbi:MAG: endonuclease/exonuclease/phosphatase family protein, partial [Leptospiraceae bacterium]|nr:endonuclease/exonuclease/phosphatase family protein [Leptospiraceae bacterium]
DRPEQNASSHGDDSDRSVRVRILHANIYRFNVAPANLQRIADLAVSESVDILILHELREEQQSFLDMQLTESYPYRLSSTEHPYFGFGIYSNRPFFVRNLIAGRIEALASIRVQAFPGCDDLFDLLAVHPVAPFNPRILGVHRRTMSSLAEEITARKSAIPVVVTGDFNSVEWSPDRRNLLQKSGLRQAVSSDRWEQLFRGTYDARWWETFRLPIDAVLVSGDIRVLELRRVAMAGSDHLGLLADVQIPDSANCASLRNFHRLSP